MLILSFFLFKENEKDFDYCYAVSIFNMLSEIINLKITDHH